MSSTPDYPKCLRKIAAYLGLLQGTAWIIMSGISLKLYYGGLTIQSTNEDSYMSLVGKMMYIFYLIKSSYYGQDIAGFEGQTVTPHLFIGFIWAYLLLNLIWFGLSMQVLRNRSLKSWSTITIIISLLDLLLVVLLGVDYRKCINYVYPSSEQSICTDVILPVLVIAARGFILWIVNVVFAIVIKQEASQLKQIPIHQPYSQPRVPSAPYSNVEPTSNVSSNYGHGVPTFPIFSNDNLEDLAQRWDYSSAAPNSNLRFTRINPNQQSFIPSQQTGARF